MAALKEWLAAYGEKIGLAGSALLFLVALGWAVGTESQARQAHRRVNGKIKKIEEDLKSGSAPALQPLPSYPDKLRAALAPKKIEIPPRIDEIVDPTLGGDDGTVRAVIEGSDIPVPVQLDPPHTISHVALLGEDKKPIQAQVAQCIGIKPYEFTLKVGALPGGKPQMVLARVFSRHNNLEVKSLHFRIDPRPERRILRRLPEGFRAGLVQEDQFDRVEVNWEPAEVSHPDIRVSYELQRARTEPDPREPPTAFAALTTSSDHTAFVDDTVEPGYVYWYRLVTVVEAGMDVEVQEAHAEFDGPSAGRKKRIKSPPQPVQAAVPGPYLFKLSNRNSEELYLDLYEWTRGAGWKLHSRPCKAETGEGDNRSHIGPMGLLIKHFTPPDDLNIQKPVDVYVAGTEPSTLSQIAKLQTGKVYRLRRARFANKNDVEEYLGVLPRAGDSVNHPSHKAELEEAEKLIEQANAGIQDLAKEQENRKLLDEAFERLQVLQPGKAIPTELNRAIALRGRIERLKGEIDRAIKRSGDRKGDKKNDKKDDRKSSGSPIR